MSDEKEGSFWLICYERESDSGRWIKKEELAAGNNDLDLAKKIYVIYKYDSHYRNVYLKEKKYDEETYDIRPL